MKIEVKVLGSGQGKDEITHHGIRATPVVVIEGHVVHSGGVPSGWTRRARGSRSSR